MNPYLNAPFREKLWFKARPECEGLYGLKSSEAVLRAILLQLIEWSLGFEPTRVQNDVHSCKSAKEN